MNKILICDADEGIRESLKLILGDYYELILTDSGEQSLECLKNAKDIRLVLIDERICGEIIGKIIENRPDVKIIIVADYKSERKLSDSVISGYITKPFKSEEILTTASKYLNKPFQPS